MREWLKVLPLGLALPVVIGAASVKPEDAASNLAAWARLVGIEQTPAWLSNPAAYNRAIIGTLVVSAIYAFIVWGIPAVRRHSKSKTILPRQISLFEAATRAYEQTRDKIVSGAAEAFENSPDDVLTWYCEALARPRNGKTLVTLWGVRPPSRKLEQIYIEPLNRYKFVVESRAVVLRPPTGSGQYENIVVDEKQVAAAIEEIAAWGG